MVREGATVLYSICWKKYQNKFIHRKESFLQSWKIWVRGGWHIGEGSKGKIYNLNLLNLKKDKDINFSLGPINRPYKNKIKCAIL